METKTDLNSAGTVDQQDLKNADVVNQQDLNNDAGSVDQQNQDAKLADGTDADKTVKYSDLKKATDAKNEAEEARKAAEEQAAYSQRQLELMQQQQLVNANPPQRPLSSMEQALADCGVTTDDLYDGANLVKVQNRKDEIDHARLQQQQANFTNQQFIIQHPDINQVVGSVNPTTGQIMSVSPELIALLSKKPHLAGACVTAEIAYDLVMQERELNKFTKTQASTEEHKNRQEIDNVSQPLGGSAAGGSGAGEINGQRMMTREQVLETERKLEAGEIVN